MKKLGHRYGQAGAVPSIIPIVILVIALLASIGFGLWAFSSRQDYKDNSDKKVAAAVVDAKKQGADAQKAADDQLAKQPNQTYIGPKTYGAVSFNYPKTWNAFVDETDTGNPIKGYWAQGIVHPQTVGVNYALRVELSSGSYSSVVNSFSGLVKKGQVTSTAYVPPKMVGQPNVQTGTRFDGLIEKDIQGSMVVVTVRDKTLKIYTESPIFLSDFNNIVLSSLTYVP